MTLDRRRFLQLSALGVIAAVADSACGASSKHAEAAAGRPRLLAMLGPERVRQLGERYRAATPRENLQRPRHANSAARCTGSQISTSVVRRFIPLREPSIPR